MEQYFRTLNLRPSYFSCIRTASLEFVASHWCWNQQAWSQSSGSKESLSTACAAFPPRQEPRQQQSQGALPVKHNGMSTGRFSNRHRSKVEVSRDHRGQAKFQTRLPWLSKIFAVLHREAYAEVCRVLDGKGLNEQKGSAGLLHHLRESFECTLWFRLVEEGYGSETS